MHRPRAGASHVGGGPCVGFAVRDGGRHANHVSSATPQSWWRVWQAVAFATHKRDFESLRVCFRILWALSIARVLPNSVIEEVVRVCCTALATCSDGAVEALYLLIDATLISIPQSSSAIVPAVSAALDGLEVEEDSRSAFYAALLCRVATWGPLASMEVAQRLAVKAVEALDMSGGTYMRKCIVEGPFLYRPRK